MQANNHIQKQHADIQRIIAEMPPLSTTVNKLLEICNDPEASPSELARVISLDPVLTGKVINLINSVYYSLPAKIGSLNRAIILLGVNTVTNLALSTTIVEKVTSLGTRNKAFLDAFWAHSICVGVTAKSIATSLDIPRQEREAYFVAGLLHDLGKIPLSIYYAKAYAAMPMPGSIQEQSSIPMEQVALGVDHSTVGGMIAEKWRLGDYLSDILMHHHNPAAADDEHRMMTATVALGNIYARRILSSQAGENECEAQVAIPSAPNDRSEAGDLPGIEALLTEVGTRWSSLESDRESILEEIEKAQIFLHVSRKG